MERQSDTEAEQAWVRIAIATAAWCYIAAMSPAALLDANVGLALGALAAAFVNGAAVLLHKRFKFSSTPRRLLSTIVDYCVLGVVSTALGKLSGPLLPVFLWVTLGNGMRFGSRHLLFAATLSVATWLAVLIFSDFWRAQTYFSAGVLIGMVAVPAYVGVLIRRLERVNARLANLLEPIH